MHHAFKTWCIVSTSGRYAIKKWQNESSATFFALGRLASAQGDKIRVLTHRKGPSGLAGGGISM